MTKLSILKRKIIRSYNNPKNKEYSKFKGYPENTFFGYKDLKESLQCTVQKFKQCYGKGLKKAKI